MSAAVSSQDTSLFPKSDPNRVGIILTLAHKRRFGKTKRIGWKVVVWALNQVYAALQLCDWPKS